MQSRVIVQRLMPDGMLPPDVLMQVQDLRRINVAGFMTEWGGVQHFADAAADKQFADAAADDDTR